jgi:hypothetical protein
MTKWIFIIVPFLFFIWYLTFVAGRLDRLHHRVETSWAILDSLLQRRAAIAMEIARHTTLDQASAYLIASSATAARAADISERSDAESALSGALGHISNTAVDLPSDLLTELSDLTEKIRLAISIHLEAVNATQNFRKRNLIRAFRLAGHAPLPIKYQFEEDSL